MSGSDTPGRFIVGIDLGTTNCAVAFAEVEAQSPGVQTFRIAQIVAPGEVERRDTLPSFHLEPLPGQYVAGSLRLPWEQDDSAGAEAKHLVGVFARDQGADAPGRLIVSAKSWLSHAGVDRTADLLPWHGATDVKKVSPSEASARYLKHIGAAWNHEHPEHSLESQQVVITIPASFDEVARELTADAARNAGLRNVLLIEEPQAAFYAWMNSRQAASSPLAPGQIVLVCDVGGGTSDFTLIEVQEGESSGNRSTLRFHRFAVGDHLILGGDNLDLAIAHHIEERLPAPLEPRAWSALIRRCQQAKETLLGANPPESLSVNAGAGGAKFLGGARRVELTRDEVAKVLLDGFLPRVSAHSVPARRASGFQEFGLPFAADPAITSHLAAFLRREPTGKRPAVNGLIRPDAILVNGGFFASPALRKRLLEVMKTWFGSDWTPISLENPHLDLAVAEGAVHFALARRGTGTKVSGGLARAYYLGVAGPDGEPHALCLVPAGMAEEEQIDIPAPFELLIRQPVEFPLFTSSFRMGDSPGSLVPLAVTPDSASGGIHQFKQLPPVRTALQGRALADGGDKVRVLLHARLSAVGILDIWCSEIGGRQRQWKLPVDVRATVSLDTGTQSSGLSREIILEEEMTARCRARIQAAFGASAVPGTAIVESLSKRLEEDCGLPRLEWPLALLRAIWQELMDTEAGRAKSPLHEARWLNLVGFSLRPGFGFPVDDWRCAQTWRLYERRVAHPRNELCRAEWWILWRRIAGGLTAGQQRALAAPLLAGVVHSPLAPGRGGDNSHESSEISRLLGSLERLSPAVKIQLGGSFLDQVDDATFPKDRQVTGLGRRKAAIWALARLGARVPLHGPLNSLIEPEIIEKWIDRLVRLPGRDEELSFAIMQMARRTGDRFRDINPAARQVALAWLRQNGAVSHHLELVEKGGELGEAERDTAFSERLPMGLRITG